MLEAALAPEDELRHFTPGQYVERSTPQLAMLLASGFAEFAVPSDKEKSAESEVALDAWHATFSDISKITFARKNLKESKSDYVRLFPGGDDRTEIASYNLAPWNGICSLRITADDGTRWTGTGWIAAKRIVVTSGHCVFLHGHGGWAREIDVILNVKGDRSQQARASGLVSNDAWIKERKTQEDYGIIVLPQDESLTEARALPFETLADELLGGADVIVAGCCSDKPGDSLWGQLRFIRETQPRRLMLNRSVFGGLSGSPVLMQRNDSWTVVGMQQDGDFAGSTALRVTPSICRAIDIWKRNAESTKTA